MNVRVVTCRMVIAVAAALLLSLPLPAGAQVPHKLTVNYVDAGALPDQYVNQVNTYVTVCDDNQRPITGLGPEHFEILEDGRPADLQNVAVADDPMAVVLAIDTSGSMLVRDSSGRSAMESAKAAAVHFVSQLGPKDKVAVFSFNREPVLAGDFTDDHQQASDVLNGLKAEANAPTCLYDTVFQAVKKAAEIPKGRRAIIVLTDGKDEKAGGQCSSHSPADVIDAATSRTTRVPIYAIGAGPKVDVKELGRMAGLTGGQSLQAASTAELASFYGIIADQLKHQYLLTYTTEAPSGEHSLVIKVKAAGRTAQDEKGFWAPPPPVMPPPSVVVVSPAPGQATGDTIDVQVRISPPDTLARVRYHVDGVLAKELSTAPYERFQWDVNGLGPGTHILRVEAIDKRGQSGFAELVHQVPLPGVPAAQAPQPPVPASRTSWIVWVVALVVVAGAGVAFVALRRPKTPPAPAGVRIVEPPAPPPPDQGDDEDKTVFFTDTSQTQTAPNATLTLVECPDAESVGTIFAIHGRAIIGRPDRKTNYVPEVVIKDKAVSRKHAEIYYENGSFYLEAKGSNPTYVDERRLAGERVALTSGVRIKLGPTTVLTFSLDADAPEQTMISDDFTRPYGQ